MSNSITEFYKNYYHDGIHNQYMLNETLRFIPDRECTILDIGCGTGWISKHFKKKGNSVIGIDISTAQIKAAKEVLDEAFIHDITEGLPFPDNEFFNPSPMSRQKLGHFKVDSSAC